MQQSAIRMGEMTREVSVFLIEGFLKLIEISFGCELVIEGVENQ